MSAVMTVQQIGDVVALAAAGDQYMTAERMTGERVQLWMYAILTEAPEMTFEQARQAIGHYYARVGNSMQIVDLIETWEKLAGKAQEPHLLARDVRIARRMGLVSRDWHEKKPLPADVVERIEKWRADDAAERAELDAKLDALAEGKRLQLDVGGGGQSVIR